MSAMVAKNEVAANSDVISTTQNMLRVSTRLSVAKAVKVLLQNLLTAPNR